MPRYCAFIFIDGLRSEISVEARDRFEAERLIRSQYNVTGPLSVWVDHKAKQAEERAERQRKQQIRDQEEKQKRIDQPYLRSEAYSNNTSSGDGLFLSLLIAASTPLIMLVVWIAPIVFVLGLVYIFLPKEIKLAINPFIHAVFDGALHVITWILTSIGVIIFNILDHIGIIILYIIKQM